MKPIDQIFTRINTPQGLKKVKIEDTPHYKLMKAIIHGGDFNGYKNYIYTYYSPENFEERLARMKEMVKNFDWHKVIVEIDSDNTLIDGTHRASLVKALGYDYIQTKKETLRDKIKKFLKSTGLLSPLYWYRFKKTQYQYQKRHREKERVIREYKGGILVETGTYEGDMVKAMLDSFAEIYSIELSKELFKKAQKRFAEIKKVHLYQGDSGKILPQILKELKQPAVFWLDAHYSEGYTAKGEKETPIFKELGAILKFPHKAILIDDARCFTGKNDYPTIEEIKTLVKGREVEVKDDIIRIT